MHSSTDSRATGARSKHVFANARWSHVAAVGALLALGIASRFHGLAEESVWLDEAITFLRASYAPDKLIDDSIRRLHNPAYFLFMHYWLQLGDDELMLRLPSAILGSLKIGLAYLAGRIAAGPRAGLVAATLVLLSPAQLRYDQEARMYAALTCGTTGALCGLLWLLRHPGAAAEPLYRLHRPEGSGGPSPRFAWAAFVLGSVFALYMHNTVVFFVTTCSVVALLRIATMGEARWRFTANWTLANMVILAAWGGPWIPHLLTQTERIQEHFWAKFPDTDKIVDAAETLYLLGSPEPELRWLLGGAAALAVLALRRQKVLLASLVLLTLLTPGLVLLVSLERPIFLMRIMLWTGVPAAVLMAAGLAWLRPRLLFALAYGAILVLGLQSLERQYYAKMRKPRWKEAIQLVSDEYRKGAALLLVGGREHRQFKYYKRRKTDPIDTPPWHSTKASQALEKLPKMMESKDTLWLVHRRTKADTRKVIRKVRRKYRLRLHEKFGRGLQVRKYVRKKRKRKK